MFLLSGCLPEVTGFQVDFLRNRFLMRQFYMNLPDELLEAARIDGAGEMWVYTRVALPLVKPAVVTVALFSAVWSWTDFMGPLIYLNKEAKWTISLGLSQFTNTYGVERL